MGRYLQENTQVHGYKSYQREVVVFPWQHHSGRYQSHQQKISDNSCHGEIRNTPVSYGHLWTLRHPYESRRAKYREEDYTVCILDAMESLGWSYKFQYDSENYSQKFTGNSYTKKECFLFHKSGL